jgi:hypothetical protein
MRVKKTAQGDENTLGIVATPVPRNEPLERHYYSHRIENQLELGGKAHLALAFVGVSPLRVFSFLCSRCIIERLNGTGSGRNAGFIVH